MLRLLFIIHVSLFSCIPSGKQSVLEKETLEKLNKKLSHHNRYAKIEAAEKIADLGPPAVATLPFLLKNLKDPDEMVRRYSLMAIGKMGPAAKPAIQEVVERLNDPSDEVCQSAARALTNMGLSEASFALDKYLNNLVTLLEDPSDPGSRVRAAVAFKKLGSHAHQATDVLGKRLLYDRHDLVRKEAAEALGKIGSPHALPFLSQATVTLGTDASLYIEIDIEILYELKRAPFALFSIVGKNFQPETLVKSSQKRKTVAGKRLFIRKSDIFFKNVKGHYVHFFTRKGFPRPFAKQIFLRHVGEERFSAVPKLLIPLLNNPDSGIVPGTPLENHRYVRKAAMEALKKITGKDPMEREK